MRDWQLEGFCIVWTGHKRGTSCDHLGKQNYIEMIYYTIPLSHEWDIFERTVSSLYYCLLQEEIRDGQETLFPIQPNILNYGFSKILKL